MKVRRTMLAAFTALAAAAQTCPTGLTRVADTVYAPADGLLFSGTITILIATPIAVAGHTYGRIPVPYTIRAGAFSACLAPNDDALPQKTSYVAAYAYHGTYTAQWTELWYVPTSSVALNISQVRGVAVTSGAYGQVASPSSWSVLAAFNWFNLSPYTWSQIAQ